MPKVTKDQVIAAYIPVIQRGYLDFFAKFKQVKSIYIFDTSIIGEMDYLRKDLRALRPAEAAKVIKGLNRFDNVELLNAPTIKQLKKTKPKLIMPSDDISHQVYDKYFKGLDVSYYQVFLRWDRSNLEDINAVIEPDQVSTKNKDVEFMLMAQNQGLNSSDIWRRIGAVLVNKQGKVVEVSENKSLPTVYSPLIDGDIRMINKRGQGLDLYNTVHAESYLVAYAARHGISLEGASIYTTDFPCPPCAKLVAESGIKKLYYRQGYAVANGVQILKSAGVTIIRVDCPDVIEDPESLRPYKS